MSDEPDGYEVRFDPATGELTTVPASLADQPVAWQCQYDGSVHKRGIHHDGDEPLVPASQIRDLLEEREELLTVIRRLRMGNHPAGRALPHLALAEALTERDAEHRGARMNRYVIDPDDREQVERLTGALVYAGAGKNDVNHWREVQDALRNLIAADWMAEDPA